MKKTTLRIVRLFAGLFLFAAGQVMTINANLGYSPWDVLNKGIVNQTGITMGQANIAVGAALLITNSILSQRIGWGTVANMIFIGIFMDFLMFNNLIPVIHGGAAGIFMMLLGLFTIGVASFLYIGAALGSGPRDGLMVALTKKTNKSVRLIRSINEITVLIIGYMLGSTVGIGTLISSFTIGHFVQLAFRIFKFDVKKVNHRFIDHDIKYLKNCLISAGSENS